MAEDNLLRSIAGSFIEHFRAAPDRRVDVDVLAGDVVFVCLRLLFFFHWTVEAVAENFKEARGEVAVLSEARLVALDSDSFLFDVHSLSKEGRVSSKSNDEA